MTHCQAPSKVRYRVVNNASVSIVVTVLHGALRVSLIVTCPLAQHVYLIFLPISLPLFPPTSHCLPSHPFLSLIAVSLVRPFVFTRSHLQAPPDLIHCALTKPTDCPAGSLVCFMPTNIFGPSVLVFELGV